MEPHTYVHGYIIQYSHRHSDLAWNVFTYFSQTSLNRSFYKNGVFQNDIPCGHRHANKHVCSPSLSSMLTVVVFLSPTRTLSKFGSMMIQVKDVIIPVTLSSATAISIADERDSSLLKSLNSTVYVTPLVTASPVNGEKNT